MKKQKLPWDEPIYKAGSPEQQLDMCETGPLRGDEVSREIHGHIRLAIDMSEPDREGSEMSGDEHSSGLEGGEEMESQDYSDGMPGEDTRLEDLRARLRHLPEEID